jgi:hypothetical protein
MNLISRTKFFFRRGECKTSGWKIINWLVSCKTKRKQIGKSRSGYQKILKFTRSLLIWFLSLG